jgi:hypothetical protein
MIYLRQSLAGAFADLALKLPSSHQYLLVSIIEDA